MASRSASSEYVLPDAVTPQSSAVEVVERDGNPCTATPAGEECDKPGVGNPKKEMKMQTSKSFKTVDVSEMFKGWPDELIKHLDEDGDGVITWDEIKTVVTKRVAAESHAARMKRIVIALVVTVCATVALNSAVTVVSLEMTKEAHVSREQLVDRNGVKVRVASSEMGVKEDGQVCHLDEFGQCLPGVVKTDEVRSFGHIFDLPLFDTKVLASLRTLVARLRGGEQLSMKVMAVVKHKGSRSATFYGAAGIRVEVNSTSMTATAVVDGQEYVIDAPPEDTRRLQDGERAKPRLYSEHEFYDAEDSEERRLWFRRESNSWLSPKKNGVSGQVVNAKMKNENGVSGQVVNAKMKNGVSGQVVNAKIDDVTGDYFASSYDDDDDVTGDYFAFYDDSHSGSGEFVLPADKGFR